MTHTVLLDLKGYVIQVWRDTRSASLDERMYSGTLMEANGEVWPGHRWDGQRFVLPPPRIAPEAVAAERQRRIETYFPERFRAQVTAFGGDNAVSMQRYLSEVHGVAESMMLADAPADFMDDRHWPPVPPMADLPVPTRHHEMPQAPVTVNVAPVINATTPEPKALVVEHRTVSESVRPVSVDEYGLDTSDPLYEHKAALVRAIERAELQLPEGASEEWKEHTARLAALATAAQSLIEFETHADTVLRYSPGVAAFVGEAA